jgi:hypothetical protein
MRHQRRRRSRRCAIVVHRLRYSADGLTLASVGADGSVCFYNGATMGLWRRVPNPHGGSG